ncbi:MAG: MotA/TolQ/ExbB proton channel family protein [bacterium]
MKQSAFVSILLVASFAIAYFIFTQLPKFIKDGGPLVVALIALTIMVTAFVFERIFSLRKAQGKGSVTSFLSSVQKLVNAGDVDGAIEVCDKQRGSMANVIRTGLERYKVLRASGSAIEQKEMLEDVKHSIEEAMMLEVPLLEKNLIALSTIASVSTMIGLLGTVIGMIRSFAAMARAGAPDPVQLSLGISEALINTAGGLIAAIIGILAYNFFTNKVDSFTYMIDEASYSIVQSLAMRHK